MVLTGLEGNSLYLITVKGFNSIGQGPATAAVTVRTRKARECCADTNQVTRCIACEVPLAPPASVLLAYGTVIDPNGWNAARKPA